MWIADRGQDLDLPALIDPNTTALVVIDMQNDFCHPDGAFGRVGHDNSRMPALAAGLHRLLAEARTRQVFTVFVRATYDREVTSRPLAQHRRRLGLLQSLCLEGTWGADWFGDIAPVAGAPNEVVLTKHRFDAFQGTPLDLYLRSNGIRTVIVTGVVTSGCVESTVRDAFFLDYRVVVPHDGVSESAQSNHEIALGVMKRSFATITSIDDVIATWRQSNVPVEPSWRADMRRDRARRDDGIEGLVMIDVDRLDPARAAVAVHLADAARQSGVPIFDVRSLDIAPGRSPWFDENATAGGSELRGGSSPAFMRIGKLRRSAFADTRLGLLLRTNEARHVTITGADAMQGGLVATMLDALDADYAVTAATDACAGIEWADLEAAGVRVSNARDVVARWRARAAQAGAAQSEAAPARLSVEAQAENPMISVR